VGRGFAGRNYMISLIEFDSMFIGDGIFNLEITDKNQKKCTARWTRPYIYRIPSDNKYYIEITILKETQNYTYEEQIVVFQLSPLELRKLERRWDAYNFVLDLVEKAYDAVFNPSQTPKTFEDELLEGII
jgi:hypothetical protein